MEDNNDLQKVLQYWREFDLDSKRLMLDKQCIEMRDSKTQSINGRKRLNDVTKLFRSKHKDDQIGMMTELLKAYQEEIDQLSRRAKFSESAFHGLYKAIYDAPDPVVAIDSLVIQLSNTSTHQLEIERLRVELAQYDQEFQQLKNQDITIRRLEDQLEEFQEKFDDKVSAAVVKQAEEAEERASQRVEEMKESQKALEKRLAAAVEAMRQAQISAERAQTAVFEVSSAAEVRISAIMAENNILAESSDRSNARVSELEREVEALRSASSSGSHPCSSADRLPRGPDGIVSCENEEIGALRMALDTIRSESRKKEEIYRSERLKLEASVRDLTLQLASEREAGGRIRRELNDRPTKADLLSVRRQLVVLQRIAFNVKDEDAEEISQDPERTLGEADQLEAMLAARLKAVESELSDTKRRLEAVRRQQEEGEATIRTLQASLESCQALVSRLEVDLEDGLGLGKGGGSKLSVGSKNRKDDMGLTELLLDDEEPVAASKPQSNSMLKILQGQRDRYKDKLSQSEAAVGLLQRELQEAVAAKEKLESDNLALFTKMRYVHSYASQGGGRTGSSLNWSPYSSLEQGGGSDSGPSDVEARYRALYETRLNPFSQFSQHEKQRKIQELSVADRLMLTTATAAVSTTIGRRFVLVYLLGLHLLVFFTLYYTAHYNRSSADCPS